MFEGHMDGSKGKELAVGVLHPFNRYGHIEVRG